MARSKLQRPPCELGRQDRATTKARWISTAMNSQKSASRRWPAPRARRDAVYAPAAGTADTGYHGVVVYRREAGLHVLG
jgi:hypothetical protein